MRPRRTVVSAPLRVRHAGGMQIAPTEPAGENGALIVCHWHTAPVPSREIAASMSGLFSRVNSLGANFIDSVLVGMLLHSCALPCDLRRRKKKEGRQALPVRDSC